MITNLKRTLILGFTLITASTLFAGRGTDIQIPLADNSTIVVRYTQMMPPVSLGGISLPDSESQRFADFSPIVVKAFKDAGLPVNIEMVMSGSKKTGDLTINVIMQQWALNSMGEYECRFSATVSNGEETIDLGYFRATQTQQPFSNSSFLKPAQKAVKEMVGHFFRG